MRILVTGATGFIGFHLAKTLHEEGHDIIAAARRATEWSEKISAFEWMPCDFSQDTNEAIWLDRLAGVDVVINAVGIIREGSSQSFRIIQTMAPQALFSAASRLGVRVIQVSAMGADTDSVQPDFLATKKEADDFLQSLPVESIIVHPAIVVGRGGTSTALFQKMAAMPITPVIGNGQQCLNPIHIDDMCRQIAHMVSNWPGGKQRYQLTGSETYRLTDFYGMLRDWLRLGKPRFIYLSLPLIFFLATLSERLGIKSLLTRDALRMLQNAQTPKPDYSACPPRSLRESLWLEPATQADTWQALWSGIRPFLFAAIAFVWFFTALTSAFFDTASGYELLAAGGITGSWATLGIYTGALCDVGLGVGMCVPAWRRYTLCLQIVLMLVYMVLIAFIVPAQWLHPFGPVTKNLPLIVATWLLLVTEPVPGQRYLKAV